MADKQGAVRRTGTRVSTHPRAGRSTPLLLLVLGALALPGCGPARFPAVAPAPGQLPPVDAVLYLIGDAGDPDSESPILSFLREDAAARSETSAVAIAFLGDNIYENGLREPAHPGREHDVRAIELQLDVLRGIGAKGVFLPGNHDWGGGGERGLANVRRQAEYVNAAAGSDLDVVFVPKGGCPGPVSLPVGESVLLVALDTEWLLRYEAAPEELACANRSADEVGRALREALNAPAAAARDVLVLAHHPLATNGSHGGYFGVTDQLFPLTNLWSPLYIPIPFLYPIVRNSGISSQDMSSPGNGRMRDLIVEAISQAPKPPIVYAAGHEHTLQVFRGSGYGAHYLLVSGAGSRLKAVEKGDALFTAGKQQRELGYMRLEFFGDGTVLLTVVTDGTAECEGPAQGCRPEPMIRYWSWLK